MEKEEELVLKSLGWKGKGLIQSVHDSIKQEELQTTDGTGTMALHICWWLLSFHFIWQFLLSDKSYFDQKFSPLQMMLTVLKRKNGV